VKRADSTSGNRHKRARLLARCATQRDDLTVLIRQLDGPIKVADRGIAGVRYLRDHPLVLGAVVALFAVIRGRGPWKWAQRGLIAWRAYRAFGKSGFKSVF
jgi:YqjK-like protein